MSPPEPQLSIIIPTINRVLILWESVKPLFQQMTDGDEIIIIDQNNPPLKLPGDLPGESVKIFRQEKPSLTRARNLGIELASGTHILFVDDDVYPDKDLLLNIRRAAKLHPGKVIAGAVDQDDTPPRLMVSAILILTPVKLNPTTHTI